MEKYKELLDKIGELGGKVFEPLDQHLIENLEKKIGKMPQFLKSFYEITNGIEAETFRILPIYDANKPKNTWDSIDRANNPETSKFTLDDKLLSRFIIFCEMDGMHCIFIDRQDNSIWFEDDDGYHKTDFSLVELLDSLINEEMNQ